MIRSISFKDFKSYREATLPLAPLVLLIGANASGKSNAIEGIRFLSWLAKGRRVDEMMSAVQGGDREVRGTIADLPYEGTDQFGFRCEAEVEAGEQFSIEIRVSTDGMRIVDESISSPTSTVPLYMVVEPAPEYSHDIQVQYNNFARGGTKPRIPCNDQQAIFTQLETPARFGKGHAKAQDVIPKVVAFYRRFLSEILFLDPSPRAMRDYSFKVERRLKGDGANLSSVLFELCVTQGRKEVVLDFVRDLPEQDIRDIDFLETQRNEVMVQLEESFGGHTHRWDAPILSDGTLRVLAVAAALHSAPQGSLVVIEEIDNGVHPSRAGGLLARIQEVASERQVRVLLTTHNPALLDALPEAAVGNVVCCYRDPSQGDSRLVRLADLDRFPELVAQGPLGQLMTREVIDRFLKDGTSLEERRARAIAWLGELKGGTG